MTLTFICIYLKVFVYRNITIECNFHALVMCEIPANIPAHERKLKEQKLEEEEDLVDKLLKKSGCEEHHYLVQECMVEHQDWRKCQSVLKNFQACLNKKPRQ